MSRNLDRALEAIDEVLGHEGQSTPEASYGVDRPGSCWRCLARAAETDTELCALCADYLKGDTDEDPTEARPGVLEAFDIRTSPVIPPGMVAVFDETHRFEGLDLEAFRDRIRSSGISSEEAGRRMAERFRVTDVEVRWGTPPGLAAVGAAAVPSLAATIRAAHEAELQRLLFGEAYVETSPEGLVVTPSPLAGVRDREQAIAAGDAILEAFRSFADALGRAFDQVRDVFEDVAEAIAGIAERFEQDEDERRERDRDRSRRALALYRRDPRRTLGPDLRATEAPRRAPHPNPRRRS